MIDDLFAEGSPEYAAATAAMLAKLAPVVDPTAYLLGEDALS